METIVPVYTVSSKGINLGQSNVTEQKRELLILPRLNYIWPDTIKHEVIQELKYHRQLVQCNINRGTSEMWGGGEEENVSGGK